eukprot:7886647-Pyramimonas_sp.AAC.1
MELSASPPPPPLPAALLAPELPASPPPPPSGFCRGSASHAAWPPMVCTPSDSDELHHGKCSAVVGAPSNSAPELSPQKKMLASYWHFFLSAT